MFFETDFIIDYGETPDVSENAIRKADIELLRILLKDHSSGRNILWMTDNYVKHGPGYEVGSEIKEELITGKNCKVIKPRINKSKQEQLYRSRDKAEVFTPSWICNVQNNEVDEAWFGYPNPFNYEVENGWETNRNKILFPNEPGAGSKSWEDYVKAPRLEISCGEAPYLVSRYDTTTGKMISIENRIGLLDRKLRIVSENTEEKEAWINWAMKAIQSCYGFEWQGDSLLIARENIILSFIDNYRNRFGGADPSCELICQIAEIVSWNIWQMDGMKFVIPCSCHSETKTVEDLFDPYTVTVACEGCEKDLVYKHNGIPCLIKDWDKNKVIKAISLLKNRGRR